MLVSRASGILTDQHVFGESDIESANGASEERVGWCGRSKHTVPPDPFVPSPVTTVEQGLVSWEVLDLKEVFESRTSVMWMVPFLAVSFQNRCEVGKEQLQERFRMFERGEWLQFHRMSQEVFDISASRS